MQAQQTDFELDNFRGTKKYAANFIISSTGQLLKNGVLAVNENGTDIQLINTRRELEETARLEFLNGILVQNTLFFRHNTEKQPITSSKTIAAAIEQSLENLQQTNIHDLLEKAIEIQNLFPNAQIPEIIQTFNYLLNSHFRKDKPIGLFLLTGADLVGLHFTPRCRLKKIVP